MKKIISIILAIITMFSLSTVAFAHNHETAHINADNTFDNFKPAPGVVAPENWYCPNCYDENGYLGEDGLCGGPANIPCAEYCVKYDKIFSTFNFYDEDGNRVDHPYETTITEVVDGETREATRHFCPYCGVVVLSDNYRPNHTEVYGVAYGGNCTRCGEFNAAYCEITAQGGVKHGTPEGLFCVNCFKIERYVPETYYRFISDEQASAPYSHLFEETAYKFGDGVDRNQNELEWDTAAYVLKKPTFWQKIADFFNKIAEWFKNLFSFVK